MKSTKKLLALLLALVLVLAACGGSTTPTDEPAETGKEQQTPAEGDEAAEGEEPAEGDEAAEGDEEVEAIETQVTDDTLVVGVGAALSGDYINGFGNSSYDVWVKNLIGNYGNGNGLATIYYDRNGEFHENPTVNAKPYETKENEDGSKTYTFFIKEGLVWSDGQPITAKDYIFGTFFVGSPEWAKTGATNTQSGEALRGNDEYTAGGTRVHEGVNLVDDYTFELTLKADYVPYFHELALVTSSPTPLHRYAPDLDIVGNELVVKEGYELSDEDKTALIEAQKTYVEDANKAYETALAEAKESEDATVQEKAAEAEALIAGGDYSGAAEAEDTDPTVKSILAAKVAADKEAELLAGYEDGSQTPSPLESLMTVAANDIAYNYRFKPDVTSGPYKFVSFENGMARVEINENFPGDAEGKKPTIKNVVVQEIPSKTDVEYVLKGDVDILTGLIDASKIEKAKNSDAVGTTNYYRNGFGVMYMLNNIGATQYKGVRQAIAYSLDRQEFVQNITGGYGVVVNSAYGVDQWEYVENQEAVDSLTNYTLNVEAANAALDTTPYTFEADGTTPWDAQKAADEFAANAEGFSYWRYDAEGNQLRVIQEGGAEEVLDALAAQLPLNSKAVGMEYIANLVDFNTLLEHYYYPDETNKDAPSVFSMGTAFATPNDPYYSYHSSQIGQGNTTNTNDPKVDKILEDMRKADPTDRETWSKGWLEYIKWFNEEMPSLPLYGNDYYDVFTNRVKGLDTNPIYDWTSIITDITIEN